MKKSGCLSVFLLLGVCASLLLNFCLMIALGTKSGASTASVFRPHGRTDGPRPFEELVVDGNASSSKIVVIPLEGVISFGAQGPLGESLVEDFKKALAQAQDDSDVKAVILQIDSPGGEVTASDVLYHAVQKFRAQSHKPVIAYFSAIGASGAYYTACGADYIMCNETTFTGSIGVIISSLNYRELFGKVGLESVVFKSGKFKDMLSGGRTMTPEEASYIQGLVMQTYDRFVGIVAESRKLSEKSLRTGVADGRILSGKDAFAAKLVDQLGYIEDAFAKAREKSKSSDAQIVRYKRTYSLDKFFRMFSESKSSKIEFALPGPTVTLQPGRLYMLPDFYVP